MASKPRGTLYASSTDDLARRVYEHAHGLTRGFTSRYGVAQLVWFEAHERREQAFRRGRQIKEWRRAWKVELIEADNPEWRDLHPHLNNLLPF